MSGLESIALAVAHLEEMSKANADRQAADALLSSDKEGPSNESPTTPTVSAQMPALVRASPSPTVSVQQHMIGHPYSFLPPSVTSVTAQHYNHHHHAARAVSSDSISTEYQTYKEGDDNDYDHRASSPSDVTTERPPVRARESCKSLKPMQPIACAAAPRNPTSNSNITTNNNNSDKNISDLVIAISRPRRPGTNNYNNLAVILADPQAWLEATQTKAIPEGPPGIFDKAEQDDVLCGRGGESNHHIGNQQYRKLVKAFQPLYISSKRRYKPRIAQCIVFTIRSFGGRFLKRIGPHNNAFEDVRNTKAREKTSQALREGAPDLRGSNSYGVEPEDYGPATTAHTNLNHNSRTSSKLAAAAAASTAGMPPNATTFLNHQHFLQAQLGPFGFHPSFGASLTPLQQALLMANHRSAVVAAAAAALPSPTSAAAAATVLPRPALAPPGAAAGAAVGATSGPKTSKRPAATVRGSSSFEETTSIDSSDASSTIFMEEKNGTTTANASRGGPRVKRLKHRVITKEKSFADDDNEKHTSSSVEQ